MSEIIRLIIMIGEIISFIIFSIVLVIECDKKRRSNDEYTERKLKKAKKANIIYFIVNNIIVIITFLLSCHQLVFLSYHKIIYLSLIFVASILMTLGYYLTDVNLSGWYQGTTKHKCGIIMMSLGILIVLIWLIGNIEGSFFGEYPIEFENCIEQKENVETIYPEFIGENKIGHIENSDRYIFGFKDNQGTWFIKDDLEVKPEELKRSDNTYIEKHIITKTFKDIERDVESDDYITTKDEVTYVLFLNEEQLIEVKND